MNIINIAENWRFRKEEQTQWENIRLPHDAMIFEARQPKCINAYNTGYYPGGRYLYEKDLELDAQAHNVLCFDGVMGICTVWLNEVKVGENVYGYTTFLVELDSAVRNGSNTLRVLCDNSVEDVSRWYTGSGIYRDVWLYTSGCTYLRPQSIRFTTLKKAGNDAVVEIEAELVNGEQKSCEYQLKATLCREGQRFEAADSVTVEAGDSRKGTLRMTVRNAAFWSDESPALYETVVSLQKTDGSVLDEEKGSFGIRSLEWKPGTGLLVNGRVTKLRGGCIHHDNGILGAISTIDVERRKIRKLKELGYNAIRSAHNPASPAQLQACDELGMYVMNEAFDIWFKPKGDNWFQYAGYWNEWAKRDMQAMVRCSYNHPCVVMYSTGNEITETGTKRGIAAAGELREWIRELDRTRPVTNAVNPLVTVTAREPKEEESPVDLSKLTPRTGERNFEEEFTGSKAFNVMMDNAKKILALIVKTKLVDKALTPIAECNDVIGYNYCVGRYAKDAKIHPERLIVGSETVGCDVDISWGETCKYPNVVGDFPWTAVDHLGEAGIGCPDAKDPNFYKQYPYRINGAGMLDINLAKKPMACFAQIVYGTRTAPYIIAEPFERTEGKQPKSSYQFTNGVRSWNWPGCEGNKARVCVFTDAERVELLLNGRKVGSAKRGNRPAAFFKVAYEPGELKAVVYDGTGNEIGCDVLRTPDSLRTLAAQPERYGELVFLPIRLTDSNGETVYDCTTKVSVQVEGGELLAFGSANPCSDTETYHTACAPLYAGEAMAVLRAKDGASVTLSCNCAEAVTLTV